MSRCSVLPQFISFSSFLVIHLLIHHLPSHISSFQASPFLRPISKKRLKQEPCLLTAPLQSILNDDDDAITPIATIGTVSILLPSKDASSTQSKFGTSSPLPYPTLTTVAEQLSRKITFFSEGQINTHIITISDATTNVTALNNADAILALQLTSPQDTDTFTSICKDRASISSNSNRYLLQTSIDDGNDLTNSARITTPSIPLLSLLPWTRDATAKRLEDQISSLFTRRNTDDVVLSLLLFFNFFVDTVPWVQHSIDATWEKGPLRNFLEFRAMVSKCGDCVIDCLKDETCKECLTILGDLDTRDQVASYRTIVSFESDLLREFSYCILQKNNVFGCDATVPTLPRVVPLERWRGASVTSDVARGILIGHLDDEMAIEGGRRTNVSWKVACGANVAYDQFPSQNQLFYPNANGKGMWYDPVFRVETIDGRNVWCKRHYKVRFGKIPGTFQFSVLDNGVTSQEFWTLVDCAEDLSWLVFHYAGAASAVGQKYLGGLLCTPDGSLPPESEREVIWKAFRRCGIEPWELYTVDNDEESAGALAAGEPPLDYFRKTVRESKVKPTIVVK